MLFLWCMYLLLVVELLGVCVWGIGMGFWYLIILLIRSCSIFVIVCLILCRYGGWRSGFWFLVMLLFVMIMWFWFI